jgi:hypothetical protein
MHSRIPEPRRPSFAEKTVETLEQGAHVVEKGVQVASALHTMYTVGRGIYTTGRVLAPFLLAL